MIIKVLFVALFLFTDSSVDALSPGPVIQTGVRDSIETEMIVRTEDLFWDSDWTFFSLDRISFRVNTGDFGYYGPQPDYLLDGIPVDPAFFGMNFPQMLPVPLNQIAEINTLNGAGVSGGVPYHSGLLKLESNPVKDGLSIYSSTQLGHNSQEPGPWIFDQESVTPNIDRFGHWMDAGFSLKFGPWYSKGHLQRLSFLHSNPFVQTRIRNLIGFPDESEWPDGRSTTHLAFLETGIKTDRLNFRVQGIQSESKEFLFFQPLGREIPTDLNMDQLTASGEISVSSRFGIRAMAQYREKGTGYRRNRLQESFDWQQTRQTGRASVYLETNTFEMDLGSEYVIVETEASGLEDDEQKYMDLFLDQTTKITPWMTFGSYTALTFHEDERPMQLRGFLDFKFTEGWSSGFEASYSELLPETANPVDEWISDGYNLLDRLDIYNLVPIEISNTELIKLSHRHQFQFLEKYKTTVEAVYFDHQQLNIPFQDAYYYLFLSTLPGGYFLFPGNSGQRLMVSLKTEADWSDKLYQSIGIYRTETLEGTPAYRRYWKTVPEYIIRHTSVFQPYPDLEMRLNLEYQTEAVWDEFRRLDGELNRSFNVQFPFELYRFSNTLSPGVNMDLTFAKWFWEQRLRVVFMLNNLFNRDLQRHPIGSVDGFGYMVRFELRF
ncbi:MAG: hypothetical protein U5K72_19480 [Balneolaceae bacterium]|nr:hypothetical protein [Balneolaceae bacterium]